MRGPRSVARSRATLVRQGQPDEPVRPLAVHAGPPRREEQLHTRGPPVLAVLVGTPTGRWSTELSAQTAAARSAQAWISSIVGARIGDAAAHAEPRVVGLAVLESWRFVMGHASHDHTHAMMAAAKAHWARRHGAKFLEHRVLSAARLLPRSASSTLDVEPRDCNGQLANFSGDRLLQRIVGMCETDLDVYVNGNPVALRDLLADWGEQFECPRCVAWSAWRPLADALASGAWYGDVSVHFRRDDGRGSALMAPTKPSDRMLAAFMRKPTPDVPPLAAGPTDFDLPPRTRRGTRTRAFDAQHLLGALNASVGLQSQDDLRRTARAVLEWQVGDAQERKVVPTGPTLRRARVRLDMACMLSSRERFLKEPYTFRCVDCDASPQRLEVFASVERLVPRGPLAHLDLQRWPLALPGVESRRLPLTSLGHKKQGLPDKMQALVHQTWLDYGGSAARVRDANARVRQVLTDMGTEIAIADSKDVVAECLQQDDVSKSSGWLYPYALQVPGPQHILDGVLKDCIGDVSWWKSWEASATFVCQWLHLQPRRQALQDMLRKAYRRPSTDVANMITSLDHGCETSQSGDGPH